ncbi:DciA family protein [Streptomyces sp. ML-6]|uniref:DciA family protein n=1 Tax=Streptomyces sp. ML-6 TaxID=2982693 RepID=UPI0024C09CE7|nr:DciA family protein [Streptomyces sp. ML-6]MDK0525044.1 DciA family protein [Streptomyces sp. ML-6]
MTDTTPSGVDLARVALAAARAAAKSGPPPKRRMGAAPSRRSTNGRDPLPFAAAITQMMAERGWDMPAKGGTILDQWPAIAPTLAGKVAAVRFDADTQTLHLRPVSPAYHTQLTLHQSQIIRQINATVGDSTVRNLTILAPGAVDLVAQEPVTTTMPRTAAAAKQPEQPRTKHPGYLAALAAHRASGGAHETGLAPLIREAADRQTQALRQRREPEAAFTEIAAQEEILQTRQERMCPSDSLQASIRAARIYKRSGGRPVRRAFEAA